MSPSQKRTVHARAGGSDPWPPELAKGWLHHGAVSWLAPAYESRLLNIQNFVSQLLNHLWLEITHGGCVYTTAINWYYKSEFVSFPKGNCFPYTALMASPFFSTPAHKRLLPFLQTAVEWFGDWWGRRCWVGKARPLSGPSLCLPFPGPRTRGHTHSSD